MYGDYAQSANLAQVPEVEIPALGQIKSAAERIARARSNIECFLERFNGGESVCGAGGTDERTSGYRNDLVSLFGQIDQLEKTVGYLNAIG